MEEDKDSKTEDPTEYRLDRLREEGQIPFSREFVVAIQTLVVIILVYLGYDAFFNGLMEEMGKFLEMSFDLESFKNKADYLALLTSVIVAIVRFAAPVSVLVLVIGVITGVVQNGFLFQTNLLTPKIEKLSPLAGVKKYISMRALVENIRNIIKFVVISVILYFVYQSHVKEISSLVTFDLNQGYIFVGRILLQAVISVSIFIIALGLFDLWYQRFQFKVENRMSRQEIREEHKEREGDPIIKARMRSMARQIANRKMLDGVKKATAVIVNPSHYAVAVLYEENMPAPKVIAKGIDFLALKIKEKAKDNDIPIVENRALARALYKKVKLGAFVPRDFFQAVAEIIAYVFKLNRNKRKS